MSGQLPEDFMEQLAATYGDANAFSKLVFGTPLHDGQVKYTGSATAQCNFLLPGNSWGKTEFIVRYALYLAWHKISDAEPTTFEDWIGQPYKGLIASYNYPIAKESFDRLVGYRKNRATVDALIGNLTIADPTRVTLTNGSIIDWGSLDGEGKLVEAARRQFIFVDEVGHIPDFAKTWDNILYPRTLGVGGRCHLLGTPKAHSDPYLLEVYEKGRTGSDPFYFSQAGSVLENTYWTEKERQRVFENPRYVTGWLPCADTPCAAPVCRPEGHPILTPVGRQVILGEFILSGGFFFNRHHIGRLFTGDHEVEWNGDNHFRQPAQEGRLYMGGFDLAGNKARTRRKKGSDPTVGFVVDYTERPWRIVRYDYIEGGDLDWEGKYALMREVYEEYRLPTLIIDATGAVDSVQEALQSRGVEVTGVQFGGAGNKKFDMLRNLQLALEMEWDGHRGLLRSPLIPKLKHELEHYALPDDHIAQDTVMCLAMVAHELVQWEVPPAIYGDVY